MDYSKMGIRDIKLLNVIATEINKRDLKPFETIDLTMLLQSFASFGFTLPDCVKIPYFIG